MANIIPQTACQLIARRPATQRGFAFQGHETLLPGNEGVQCFGGNNGAAADANGAQTTGSNVLINCRFSEAGGLARLLDAVAQLRRVFVSIRHCPTPFRLERRTSYVVFLAEAIAMG